VGKEKTGIAIIEDHPVMRNGLAAYFRNTGQWDVCGTASTVAEAKELLTMTFPEILLLDLQLEDGWGLDIIPCLNQRDFKQIPITVQSLIVQSKIVQPMVVRPLVAVYSAFDDHLHVKKALDMGVRAYVTKRRSESELEKALLKALNGEIYIDEIARIKFQEITSLLKLLTGRETEIFNLVKNGLSNIQIAARLGISKRTVENMLSCVYSKTGIKTRMELKLL
jgi:NarL family two-component system response regulator LiaR